MPTSSVSKTKFSIISVGWHQITLPGGKLFPDKLTQGRAGRDGAHGSVAVAKLGRNSELSLFADAHAQQIVVPTFSFICSLRSARVPLSYTRTRPPSTGAKSTKTESIQNTPFDYLAGADGKGQRRAAVVAGVKLGPVRGQRAAVVH